MPVPQPTKNLADLKSEILSSLPLSLTQQNSCTSNCNCQINKNLLEYFIQIELSKLSTPNEVSIKIDNTSKEESLRVVLPQIAEVIDNKEATLVGPVEGEQTSLNKLGLDNLQEAQ